MNLGASILKCAEGQAGSDVWSVSKSHAVAIQFTRHAEKGNAMSRDHVSVERYNDLFAIEFLEIGNARNHAQDHFRRSKSGRWCSRAERPHRSSSLP